MQWTIHRASDAIRQGKLSPVQLLEECLQQVDRYEGRVRAWVFVDREGARAAAKAAEVQIDGGNWRGPLHGIPLAIKDIFDVFDWPTAMGSKLWAHSYARRDCTVVQRLRQAGAILMGKTVTTPYASFDPPPTRNPWDLTRTPGGSSSGSAAALACGMCLGALGSQTGGSITRPASYCGVAGMKPTFGRVSVDGVGQLAPSMDHPGPMARCVADLAILLKTIAGPDVRDYGCSDLPVPDYPHFLEEDARPPRLGRLRDLFQDRAEPAMQKLVKQASDVLTSAGATVTDLALPAGFSEVIGKHRIIMAVEAAMFHGERLRRHPDDYGPNIRKLLEEGLACAAPEYGRAREFQGQLFKDTMACFKDVDAFLCPASTGPAPAADTTGDPALNSPWSLTGLPVVSFPVGRSPEGLPLAIQLVGPAWSEAELLSVAHWCEQKIRFRMDDPPAK